MDETKVTYRLNKKEIQAIKISVPSFIIVMFICAVLGGVVASQGNIEEPANAGPTTTVVEKTSAKK